MTTPLYGEFLRVTQPAAKSRAEITDSTVRTLLAEEAGQRFAQLQKLKKARLAMEAKAAAEAKPVAPKKRRAPQPKFAG
ncbi:hypothetical protein [Maricaulis maris]|jgi:hypothetical protein|uniref:hypothetical protein n=1 Tax=Maricaulis maris TaxID=74318 RepID=UPI0029265E16|nr:hypothetical protein MACH15_11090 [Maricaulis maris]